MKYYSTRDKERSTPFTLKSAAFLGLAPDGGLFMPEHFPQVDMQRVSEEAEKSFADMAGYLAELLFGEDVPQAKQLAGELYQWDVPLANVSGDLYTLQLFHGPTLAFKDFGAGFMGRMLGCLREGEEELTVLTATSGDTGSAVANGFYNVPGVRVVILYPEGKVSDFQEAQMTTLGGNINAVRVKGTFDDCQAIVKQIFNDKELRQRKNVTSANSINILRWIPQSFYYFYGWYLWKKTTGAAEMPAIAVPSGNWGNITSGILAQRMGLPVRCWIAGSNANDEVPQFLAGKPYLPRPSVQTVANAMDVGAPSNFERLLSLFDGDEAAIRASVKGFSYSDSEILQAVAAMNTAFGYLSDPHSAVGYLSMKAAGEKGFWLSTAAAAKFDAVCLRATGIKAQLPSRLAGITEKPRSYQTIDASAKALIKLYF